LTEEDLRKIHLWLDAELARGGKPAMGIMLESFDGYADAPAFWEDLKIDSEHAGDMSRVAIVADLTWLKWGTVAANPFTGADLKWFATKDRDLAIKCAKDRS
jgi:hypothetical protein